MPVMTATSVGKSYGADDIFGGMNFDMQHGTRIALVGLNGAGKTTLLRILIRAEDPSAGEVFQMKGLSIGYLPQRPELVGKRTLWEEMLTAFTHLQRRESELADLAAKMADTSRPNADDIIARYGRLQEEFELAGGEHYRTRVRRELPAPGFFAHG